MSHKATSGFTLVEVVLGVLTLTLALVAIFGAYAGQVTFNEHARNLSLAIEDANRVLEQIRSENVNCQVPEVVPQGAASWNAWMNTGGAGAPKSLGFNPDTNELIVVTCQDNPVVPPAAYCGDVDQMGTGEWAKQTGVDTNYDPLRITVSVCWRHRARTIGECTWNGDALAANDANGNGVIDSPAMLTTLVTCR